MQIKYRYLECLKSRIKYSDENVEYPGDKKPKETRINRNMWNPACEEYAPI